MQALPLIGAGLSAAQGVGSLISGWGAAQRQQGYQNDLAGQADWFNRTGRQEYTDVADKADWLQHHGGNRLAQLQGLTDNALGNLPGIYTGAANDLAGQRVGEFNSPGVTTGAFTAPGMNPYDFTGTQDTLGNVRQQSDAIASRARDTALERSALAFRQGGDSLNAALADRGISADSGVAAGALSDLAYKGAQSQTELERNLADSAAQRAMQAGQFDASNALQMAGLGSQYNLGFNELQQGRALNQFNANLSRDELANRTALQGYQANLAGNQFNAGLINQSADLNARAYTDPLALAQQNYQQNFQQPELAYRGMLNPAGMMQTGSNIYNNLAGNEGQAAGAAGMGFGSSLSTILGLINMHNRNQNPAGTPGAGGYDPRFGVGAGGGFGAANYTGGQNLNTRPHHLYDRWGR